MTQKSSTQISEPARPSHHATADGQTQRAATDCVYETICEGCGYYQGVH